MRPAIPDGWRRVAPFLAVVFALCGTLAVALLATAMPPFQNADEESNFLRADQVSRGGLLPAHYDAHSGGGVTEPNITAAADAGAAIRFHADRKVDPAVLARQRSLGWTTPTLQTYANTAFYPPVLYLPAAAATRAGRALGFTVVGTLDFARIVSGLASVALGTAAVALAGTAAPWLFALLCLPMSLAQMAAVNHDGPAIGCAALAAALIAGAPGRLDEVGSDRTGRARLFGATLALLLLATDRPPMAILALFLLLLPGVRRAGRLLAVAVVWIGCLAWAAYVAPLTGALTRGDIDPAAQARFLLAHPLWIATVAHQTIRRATLNYVGEFVGRLGWLDTALPHWLHLLAWAALALALALSWRGRRLVWSRLWLGGAAILATAAAIFLVQYLTWTPVGAEAVLGVQGRYFIPVACFVACLLPTPAPGRQARAVWILVCCLALFPLAATIGARGAIETRYYASPG